MLERARGCKQLLASADGFIAGIGLDHLSNRDADVLAVCAGDLLSSLAPAPLKKHGAGGDARCWRMLRLSGDGRKDAHRLAGVAAAQRSNIGWCFSHLIRGYPSDRRAEYTAEISDYERLTNQQGC